jgi:hypothetical protein
MMLSFRSQRRTINAIEIKGTVEGRSEVAFYCGNKDTSSHNPHCSHIGSNCDPGTEEESRVRPTHGNSYSVTETRAQSQVPWPPGYMWGNMVTFTILQICSFSPSQGTPLKRGTSTLH